MNFPIKDLNKTQESDLGLSAKSSRPLSASASRIDIRSTSRMANSMSGAPIALGIQSRRQQIVKYVYQYSIFLPNRVLNLYFYRSVLRPLGSTEANIASNDLDESAIAISYKTFCNDIYPLDWL